MKPNRFSIARRLILAAFVLLGASCAGPWKAYRYEAETGPWGVRLVWTHNWKPADAGDKTCQGRFESLELILPYNRRGEDLRIDDQAVAATFEHGARASCSKPHRVEGVVRVLDYGATDVRARVNAVMHCPDAEPIALKGEFKFDVKVPP